jgi:hypothetical protein
MVRATHIAALWSAAIHRRFLGKGKNSGKSKMPHATRHAMFTLFVPGHAGTCLAFLECRHCPAFS